ncbi:MAG: penicillin-binding protein 2 [Thermoleophilia bacterium]|nr:penicillin-binding protein 2 [Thermoleophilia bacterium]MCZ4497137.1 penicillin-binding protein 2 [Thermoleophilia bacterium]
MSRLRTPRRGGRTNPGAFSPRRAAADLARSSREGAMPVAPRIAVAGIIGAVVFGILVLRLWALTVLGGAEYAALADQNQMRQLRVEAPRGSILDRNGEVLVANRASEQVVLNLQDVPEARLDGVISSLSRILDVPEAEIREDVENAPPGGLEPIIIRGDLAGRRDEQAKWYLREHRAEFPGVDITTRQVRDYLHGTAAAHILGQVGQVSEEQLETSHTNRKSGDRIGVSGIERQYDEYLRGVDGYQAIQVDAAGVRQGEGRGLPAAIGRSVKLTIDLGLQKATQKSLREGIAKSSRTADGAGAFAGAAVAIDPRNGEILASASEPTYDPGIFVRPGNSAKIDALLKDKSEHLPMFNRVIGGAYPPGSIYKPITALAAMDMGPDVLTPDRLIECPPSFPVGKTIFRNHVDRHMGSMNLAQSLETSCDTYYYKLALYFYQDPGSPLQDWSRKFGLGAPTGIDIPGEIGARVPTVAWKKSLDHLPEDERSWRPGDSINMSIGQGDLLVTPLQMANVFAALGNGGTLHTPHLGMQVEDPSGRAEIGLHADKPRDLKLDPGDLAGVEDGLVAVTSGVVGTARAVFGTFEVPTAGKTGTAEKFGQKDIAWYCGYAPVDDPEIAACAVIDGGGHGGSDAAPIVLGMLQQHFKAEGGTTDVKGATID